MFATSAPMEDSSRSSPIVFSGGLSAGEEAFLAADYGGQSGSAAGSLQGEGLLAGDGGGSGSSSDAEFGFQRAEFGRAPLAGTVQAYDRHVFLCYKTPQVWPSHVEAAESDRLPRLLSAALAVRKGEMKKRTRLTICEGEDGTESSNGDVLIFPDMIRYRRLTHFDVDNFVEEVLVKDTEWPPGEIETLKGSYIFVCAHGSRDRRCGVCGPVLIKKFNEEIDSRGLQGNVFVSPCSHIGGHKYAGNVIIFGPNIDGEVTGHWYGYVAPDDVPILIEQHIGKGYVVHQLWRGQMGLSEEDQKKAQELRVQLVGGIDEKTAEGSVHGAGNAGAVDGTTTAGCCQGVENPSCCQNGLPKEKLENGHGDEPESRKIEETKRSNGESKGGGGSSKGASPRKICPMPTWYETWECEDTYAALAVVAAAASVAIAYSCYKQLR